MSEAPEKLFMFQRHHRDKWYGYPWPGAGDVEYIKASSLTALTAELAAALADKAKAKADAYKRCAQEMELLYQNAENTASLSPSFVEQITDASAKRIASNMAEKFRGFARAALGGKHE